MRFRACIAVVLAAVAAGAVAEPLRHVRIETAEGPRVAAELEHAGFDVLWGSITDKSVELIVSARSLDRLRADGFEPVTIAVGRPFREIQAERMKDAEGDIPPGYPDYDEIIAEMTAAAAAYPDICQMVNLTETYAKPPTYEGRHLYAVKISDNVTLDEDEPAMLVVSCHHAREISTPTIAMHAIEQFTTQYGIDPEITAAVDGHEIWIAPVWNPDGYQYVFDVDDMWRKNRRVFTGGIGVDQNRNYPFGWTTDCSGSTDPSSDIYKGPSAGSEPETRTLMAWSEDRRFARVIDYHTSGREALYGYASGCMTHPFNSFLQQEAIALSTASGYSGDNRPPSADGEHFQWQLAEMGAMSNLIETHTSFHPTYASAEAEAAMVFPGIMWMLERPTPLWGRITDAITGEPVEAEVTLVGMSYPNGEHIRSGGDFGRYYAVLPPGTYDLYVEAEGYDPMTVSDVAVTAGMSAQMDIALCPPAPLLSPSGGDTLPVNVPTTVTWDIMCAMQHQVQSTTNYGDIGEIADSFERATVGPNYETGGAAPWQISFSFPLVGSRSVRSGDVSSNEVSWMTRTVAGGVVSFWYYVNSEENGDFFNFYVNGTREVHASGATGWQGFSTSLPAGTYELKWEYAKNATISFGYDAVWVDFLEITADQTVWTDIVALTDPGATSVPWTPTVLSDQCKVRIRGYYDAGYYGAWGETDDVFTVAEGPAICPGDADCNGMVDFDDIDYFVAGLGGEQAWIDLHLAVNGTPPACLFDNCDANSDGSVDFDDIDMFVSLIGSDCQ